MSDIQLYKLLVGIAFGLILLGVILGYSRYGKLGRIQKLLLLVMVLALGAELCARILIVAGLENQPLFHVYTPFEYTAFGLLFSKGLNGKIGKVLLYSIIPFWLFAVGNVIFFQGIDELNTNVTTVESIILIMVPVLGFTTILSEMRYSHIEKSSFFWINIGVLVYFSSSLLLFVYSNWLTGINLTHAFNAWVIHLGFNIFHYLCFNIALWMKPE